MNHCKRKGFVLIFVITTLALMSAMFVVLGSASNMLLFETNTVYLDSCSRNLSASSLAWAKYNIRNKTPTLSGRIPLDVNDMDMPAATLSVEVGAGEVVVHTSVSRGKQHLQKTTAYAIQR